MISNRTTKVMQALIVASSRDNMPRSWYDPSKSHTLKNACVVKGCGQPAAYHLCVDHAFPGWIDQLSPERSFVIGCWFAERKGNHFLVLLHDYLLGRFFGNRQQFEEWLISDGYVNVRIIPTEKDLRTVFLQYPCVFRVPWVPDPDSNEGFFSTASVFPRSQDGAER
jgi:hypothetical protein